MVDLVRKNATSTAAGEIPAGAFDPTTNTWILGVATGIAAGAAAYHKINGSIVGASQRSSSPNQMWYASIDSTVVSANLYADNSANPKAIATQTGYSFINITRQTTIGGTAFDFNTNYQDAQTADGTRVTTNNLVIATASAGGSWVFGSTSTAADVSHSFRGTDIGLVRNINTPNNSTVQFSASDPSGLLCQLGGYKNSSLAAATGFMSVRNNVGTIYYMWIGAGTALWRTSSTATDIGTTNGTVVGDQTSDERLKENIVSLSYGLSEVMQIQPISFEMDGRRQIGFSAQQVKDILPEVVYDTGEVIDDSGDNKLAMQYANMNAVLVNAIKELKEEFDAYVASHP